VPDALTTMSQYLDRLEESFSSHGTSVVSDVRSGVDEERRRPSPAALGVLVQRVTNLLRGQASTTLAVNLFLTLLRVPSILIGS
jgi:hypothetical protein